jgi:hypothetical protein
MLPLLLFLARPEELPLLLLLLLGAGRERSARAAA